MWRLLWRIMRRRWKQLYVTFATVGPDRRNLIGFDDFVVFEGIEIVLDVDRGPFLDRTRAEKRVGCCRATFSRLRFG